MLAPSMAGLRRRPGAEPAARAGARAPPVGAAAAAGSPARRSGLRRRRGGGSGAPRRRVAGAAEGEGAGGSPEEVEVEGAEEGGSGGGGAGTETALGLSPSEELSVEEEMEAFMRKQAELERKGGTVQEFAQPVGTSEVSDADAAALVAEIIGIAKTLKDDSDMTLNELGLIVSIDEPIQGAANMGIEVRTPRPARPLAPSLPPGVASAPGGGARGR